MSRMRDEGLSFRHRMKFREGLVWTTAKYILRLVESFCQVNPTRDECALI